MKTLEKNSRPLLKWTGGKYSEFKYFQHLIPPFKRYIEPFFGGGGVFFALQTEKPKIINDLCKDLIDFYCEINNKELKKELLRYTDAWDAITKTVFQKEFQQIKKMFFEFLRHDSSINEKKILKNIHNLSSVPELSDPLFILNFDEFINIVYESVIDKFKRIKRIENKEKKVFSDMEIHNHLETAIKSGFYFYFRNLLNYSAKKNINKIKKIANWYIIRELCYGSMFRYNSNGGFNIPYGGIAYNKKNLRLKVNQIFDLKTQQLFSNCLIKNIDFETFFKSITFSKTDFVFLDPPYDTEFSEYDGAAFTRDDQNRLAQCLLNINAKWLLVIKNTEYIYDLYNKKGIIIEAFDKSYTYNVRGRNVREVEHLMIRNYSM